MSYWHERNHSDSYAFSLEFEMIDNELHVSIGDRKDWMFEPYEASDIYIGAYNSSVVDFTTCDECSAAGYEEYFIANLATGLGYCITPRDAQELNEEGSVVIEPLGKEFDEDVKELIDEYLKELEC